MNLLQSLLSIKSTTITESADMHSLISKWQDANSAYSLEGSRGVSNLTKLVAAIGYSNLDYFLSDNPGALTAVIEWISGREDSEWAEGLGGDSGDDLYDALEKWQEANNIYHFEGDRGVRAFAQLVGSLGHGYSSIEEFFADNSGAIEAVIDFISSAHVSEWQQSLSDAVGGDDLDEAKKAKDADDGEGDEPVNDDDEPVDTTDQQEDALLAIATKIFGIADWDEESHQDASGGKLQKALQAAFDAGVASVADQDTQEDAKFCEDIRISNIRPGNPLYDKLLALTSEDELAEVRRKAWVISVKKKYKGASFSVVGKTNTDDVYFRIVKADIQEESSNLPADKAPKQKISESIEDDQSEAMDRFHDLVYAKMATIEQQLQMKKIVDAFAKAYEEDDEGSELYDLIDAMNDLNDEIQDDRPNPKPAPWDFGNSYEFPKEGAIDEAVVTTGLKLHVADLEGIAQYYFQDITEKAANDLLDDFIESQSELTIEYATLKNGVITFVPHFGDTIEPRDQGRIISNLANELESFAMEYIDGESRHIVDDVTAQLKNRHIRTTKSEVYAWLIGGGFINPKLIDQLESQLGYDNDATFWDGNAAFWNKLGITEDKFSILAAASA